MDYSIGWEIAESEVHVVRQILHLHLLQPGWYELRSFVCQVIRAKFELFKLVWAVLHRLKELEKARVLYNIVVEVDWLELRPEITADIFTYALKAFVSDAVVRQIKLFQTV